MDIQRGLSEGEIACGRDAGGVVPAAARALPETRPAAADFGLPEEISGDSLARGGEEEGNQAAENFAKARAQSDRDYEETAAAVAEKQALTAAEEAELNRLWRKLVKLYHPDRFAHEPDKLATYEKLTAAINRAKEAGDIQTLREIAEDPAGHILRQGWTGLDFSDEVELAELRRLHESLQLEIIAVIGSLDQLKESAELQQEAQKLAEEIKELSGKDIPNIA